MSRIVDQLKSMKVSTEDVLTVGIFVSSFYVPELFPVVASIKTLSEDKITWERVSTRLIGEVQSLKNN